MGSRGSKSGANKAGKELGKIAGAKQQQLEIILQNNPMTDEYHVGIRTADDIKTLQEAYDNYDPDEELVYPDYTENDVKRALQSGYITVYSSNNIKKGTFVSPSRMMAEDYAGGSGVKSMRVPISDIAWINLDEGQYAPISRR